MRVVVSSYVFPVPRMTINPEFAANMPKEFVERTNAWMLKFFGTEEQVVVVDNIAFVSPRLWNKLVTEGHIRRDNSIIEHEAEYATYSILGDPVMKTILVRPARKWSPYD